MSLDLFHHIYINNQAEKTLVLLHGTGADEHDLLPLAQEVANRYNLVSLRGNANRFGMRRFFDLLTPTSFLPENFDQHSLAQETAKLGEFVHSFVAKYNLDTDKIVFLGYSNGANMILATLFAFPALINQAVLLHPLLPSVPPEENFEEKRFLVSFGQNDQLIKATHSQAVVKLLKEKGAKVQTVCHSGGHELARVEIEAIKAFLV